MINTIQGDIDKIVREIRREIKGVKAIYLFGSIARGNDTLNSDYDIAVIVKNHPEHDLDLITDIKFSLIDLIKKPLDIVILDDKDLNNSPVLLYELYNNNKKLYGRVDVLKKSRSAVRKIRPIIEDNKTIGYHV